MFTALLEILFRGHNPHALLCKKSSIKVLTQKANNNIIHRWRESHHRKHGEPFWHESMEQPSVECCMMHTASLNKDCMIELFHLTQKRSHEGTLPSQSLTKLNLTQQLVTRISRPKHTPTPNEHHKLKCRFGWLVYVQCGKRIVLFDQSHLCTNLWRYYVSPPWNDKNDFDCTVTKDTHLVHSWYES